jgi:hypothetical protein
MVPLFSKRRDLEIQSFMVKLINNNCASLESFNEGPRDERRVRLTVVILLVPVKDGKPNVERMIPAVTKEFSTRGVAVVTNEPRGFDQVVLGFRCEGYMKWIAAKAKYVHPMGAGFYQAGFLMNRLIPTGDHSELDKITF